MRYIGRTNDGDDIERYGIKGESHGFVPCMNVEPDDAICDWLLAERVGLVQARDALLAAQKQTRDRDTVRAIKTEAQAIMRRYRALCLHIPWFVARPPGDCRTLVRPALWPLELEEELDDVGRRLCLMSYGGDA